MSPGEARKSTAVVAVDTGGTFTDLILLKDGEVRILKVPSTPEDPSAAVLEGLRKLVPDSAEFRLVHGSTVATNALLERTGARVALVTNQGFEDVVEIRRQDRPALYALHPTRPPPLVAPDDRVGIPGRIAYDGTEVEPLSRDALQELSARLEGAESVAVCLLHSYAHPDHEDEVARALEPLQVPVSLSSRILPEYREYERTATTVVNAYVRPVMSRYLSRIEEQSGAERVRIMGSDGGALSVSRASTEPVHTVLSGPAGGVVGGLEWARRTGWGKILTFDMGGTSTDVALVPGRLLRTREFHIADTPVAIPLLDIHTVGAGGGSLAHIDAGGALRVGPASAGADPGPVVYGRGGSIPTVTDAHVLLGRLPPESFLGGEGSLDIRGLREAFLPMAETIGGDVEEVASGVLSVANTAMEGALRVISVDRGHDPRDFALVSFGGAGGLHAAALATRLGVATVIVPPDPGLLSAFGMLAAPVTRERSRTLLLSNREMDGEGELELKMKLLEEEAREEMEREGHDPAELEVERWVDARYRGQSFEITVPASDWVHHFHRRHRERYGYARNDAVVEAVTLRARVRSPGSPPTLTELPPAQEPSPPTQETSVYTEGRWSTGKQVWRSSLRPGHRLDGPVRVLEYSSTTWVPPGWHLQVHPTGALLLTVDPPEE